MKNKLISLIVIGVIFLTPIFSYADDYKTFIDPGHGGSDSGAISYDNKYQEKDLNLKTAISCRDELNKHNIDTKMSREDDSYLTLEERSKMSNKYNPDVFISIHHNASENTSVNRGEVIYSVKEQESQRLAECLASKLYEVGNVEVKIYNRYNASGSDYYGVLRKTDATAIIVEVSFITSEKGMSLVDTDEKLEKNGILIAQGVMDFLGVNYPDEKDQRVELEVIKSNTNSSLDKLLNSLKGKNNKKNGMSILYEIMNRGK